MKSFIAQSCQLLNHGAGRRFLRGAAVAVVGVGFCAGQATSLAGPAPKPPKPLPPVGHFVKVATHQATYEVAGEEGPEVLPLPAEIIAASPDANVLVYTTADAGQLAFLDIRDPASPTEIGRLAVNGVPTSVATTPDGNWILAVVTETPADPEDPPQGHLLVLDWDLNSWTRSLGGQPDCIAVSPDGRYAAITIENERADSGPNPDLPPGNLTVVDLVGNDPASWAIRIVDVTGYGFFPDDPEPEFVAINAHNQAALTLQENNHVVIVDLPSGSVISEFPAGETAHYADLEDDDTVSFTEWLVARREPDGIAWTPNGNLITANEGDSDVLPEGVRVGGRNFTVFSPAGRVVLDPGATLEVLVARAGLYDDSRSDNKGIEPEGVTVGQYLNHAFFFVGLERARSVAVYRFTGSDKKPQFVQLLETGGRPEGLLALPQRNLFVSADEDGTVSIFQGRPGAARK